MLFYPGLFRRRRKNERARETDEAGTRGGGGGEEAEAGTNVWRRVCRLIDEFRLEIFAVPYALNRRTRVRRNSRPSKVPITGNKNEQE